MAETTKEFRHLPKHYHRVGPFRELFRRGTPILTYHAIGAPPCGTRFRGLFYPARHFSRQLAELRAAGFRTVTPAQCLVPVNGLSGRIALTFDDGFQSVTEHALAPLAENGFQATVFLVAKLLGRTNEWDGALGVAQQSLMDHAEIAGWLAAGNTIGSHTLTHPHLTRIPLAEAREQISASKKMLEDLFGVAVEDFCYPYGEENQAVRDLAAEAGYRTACTTAFDMNTPGVSPFALRRIIVRTPPRSLKTLRSWLVRQFSARAV